MTQLPKVWTPHTVQVEPFQGEGANGVILGEKVTVEAVYVRDVSKVVTDDSGAEVVSRAKVYFNFDDTPRVGSRVTIWPGSTQEKSGIAFKQNLTNHPDWPGRGVVWLR